MKSRKKPVARTRLRARLFGLENIELGRLLSYERLEQRRLLTSFTTVDWTGKGDGSSWADAANWSAGALPGPTDDVVISAPAGVTVTHGTGSDTIHSLQSSSPLTLSGGTLTVATTVEVDNTFTLSGGTLVGADVKPGSGGQGITATTSGGTLDGVTLEANLDLGQADGANVTVADGMTLSNSTIYIGNAADSTSGQLYFNGTQTLGGAGTVVFGKGGNNQIKLTDGDYTLTVGPNVTIRGSSGTIGANNTGGNIVNQGRIAADDSGGGSWGYDSSFSGGVTAGGGMSNGHTIDTSGVSDPAPQEVYQTERAGQEFTYTLSQLTPGAEYTVRLHFAENFWDAAGQRLFNVSINGTQVLTNFDIVATAGGQYKAVVEPFKVSAGASGQIAIEFKGVPTATDDNAAVNGIELDDASGKAIETINAGLLPGGTITVNPIRFSNQGTIKASADESLNIAGLTGSAGAMAITGAGANVSINGSDYTLGNGFSIEWHQIKP